MLFYKKKIIICDRFIDSTLAYQHYGLGVKKNVINFINKEIMGTMKVDYTFLMYLNVDKSISRISCILHFIYSLFFLYINTKQISFKPYLR